MDKAVVAVVCLLVFALPFLVLWIDTLFNSRQSARRFKLNTLLIAITVICLALRYVVYEVRK